MEQYFNQWLQILQGMGVRYILFTGFLFLTFYIIFYKKIFWKKIQLKSPKQTQIKRELKNSILTIMIFSAEATIFWIWIAPHSLLYHPTLQFGVPYLLFSTILILFLHDTYFYWTHRFMHHKKIYKYIHKVHHQSTNPTPFTSYSFHPLETMLEALITPILAFLLPINYYQFIGFLIFQLIFNIYGHLGYEIFPKRFHKTAIGKWISTSIAHNMHHQYFNGNYGLYFLFWDRLMGTIHPKYDEKYEEIFNRTNDKKISQANSQELLNIDPTQEILIISE